MNKIMGEKKSIVTPADVAKIAAEENLVVPTQTTPEGETTVEITEDGVRVTEVTVELEDKKSFKARLVGLGEKLKEHKKAIAVVGAVAGVAAVAALKYIKKQAELALAEEDGTPLDEPVGTYLDGETTGDMTDVAV